MHMAQKLKDIVVARRGPGCCVDMCAKHGQLFAYRCAVQVAPCNVSKKLGSRRSCTGYFKDRSETMEVVGSKRPRDKRDGVATGSENSPVVEVPPSRNERLTALRTAGRKCDSKRHLDK